MDRVHEPPVALALSTAQRSAPAALRRVCGAATTGSSGHQVCRFVPLLHFAPFVRPRENVINNCNWLFIFVLSCGIEHAGTT